MKLAEKSQARLKYMTIAISRFWFSTASFLLAMFTILVSIQNSRISYDSQILSLISAGMLGIVAQLTFERFFSKQEKIRWIFYGGSLILSFLYYLFLNGRDIWNYPNSVRAAILMFILLMSSVWIPAVKQEEFAFSKSFIIFIKSFFTSFLYSLVLNIGLFLILGAFAFLISQVEFTLFAQTAAIIWSGFFPIYFLSLIPIYPTDDDINEEYQQAINVPKFLEILLSYIIIPLIIAYSFILLLYILQNLTQGFWQNSLLEPLLVSYVIVGWFTLFSIDTFTSNITRLFKKFFPPILLIVTTLQGVSSLVKLRTFGLTDGRYLILLLVIFSIVSSVIYLFAHPKIYLIPALLIALSILSIFPYIDAISLATRSQVKQLETVLTDNNMLVDNRVIPDGSIPETEKQKIVDSYNYLRKVNMLYQVEALSLQPNQTIDFTSTFGFNSWSLTTPEKPIDPTDPDEEIHPITYTVRIDPTFILQIDTSDQEMIIPLSVYQRKFGIYDSNIPISYQNQHYIITWEEEFIDQSDESKGRKMALHLEDEQQNLLADYDLNFLLDLVKATSGDYEFTLSPDDLTFSEQFDDLLLTLYVTNLSYDEYDYLSLDFYLGISFNEE